MGASSTFNDCVVVTNDGLIRNCAYAHGSTAMRVEEVAKRLDYAIESSKSIRKDSKPSTRPFDSFENKTSYSFSGRSNISSYFCIYLST